MAETRIPAELEALARDYRRIPLWKSIPALGRGPTDVFLALKNLSRQCFILESLEDPERWGRYTFIGDDIEIAGASPETLVKLENGTLFTFPLAGTKPRGKGLRRVRLTVPP
jgi:anthranilate synthase component 1